MQERPLGKAVLVSPTPCFWWVPSRLYVGRYGLQNLRTRKTEKDGFGRTGITMSESYTSRFIAPVPSCFEPCHGGRSLGRSELFEPWLESIFRECQHLPTSLLVHATLSSLAEQARDRNACRAGRAPRIPAPTKSCALKPNCKSKDQVVHAGQRVGVIFTQPAMADLRSA